MKKLVIGFLALLFNGSLMLAQLPTGTILGTVKDTSGALIPNASITAREADTGQTRATVTAGDGSFRLDSINVGNYTLTATAVGFKTDINNGVVLTVGQEAVSNFTLQIGSQSETVTVSTQPEQVNTTTSSLGSLVDQAQINDLPLNGRNYNSLTLLQPGVTMSLNSNNSTIGYNGTQFSSNGFTARSNNYMIDGAIMTNVAGLNGASATGATLGVDGILEYKVITNSFDAEYGMNMGSQMTIVSKGGTNKYHGDVFEFLRNSSLDARNFFDLTPAQLGHRLPEFRRNQFGGYLGGPIKKDKLFFFGVYEGLRSNAGLTETQSTLAAGCHQPAGTAITPAMCSQLTATETVNPLMQPFVDLYPIPNVAGTNFYGFVFQQATSENYYAGRIDYTLSHKDNLFGHYTYDAGSLPYVGNFNQSYSATDSHNHFLTLAEVHVFNPSLLNSIRFSYSRNNLTLINPVTDSRLTDAQHELVAGLAMGSISPGGVTGVGTNTLAPRIQKRNLFTYDDDLNYTLGHHSLKFGMLYNHYQDEIATHGYDKGVIAFSSVNTFFLDNAANPTSTFSIVLAGGIVTRYFKYDTMGFYAQDSWKLTPRLVLNLGMRYEPTTDVVEVHGNASGLRNLSDSSFTNGNPVFSNPSHKNWSPRFGFAWDVFGNGSTAVRGGFDVLYDLATFGTNLMNYAGYDPPYSDTISISNYGPITKIPIVIPTATGQLSYRGPAWQANQPHGLSYNLAIQKQLPARMALSVAYAGSRGINLIQVIEGNNDVPNGVPSANGGTSCIAPAPGTTLDNSSQFDGSATSCYLTAVRANPNFSSFDWNSSTGSSDYNSLQANLDKRVSHGLQLQAAFTWSKLLDNQEGGSGQDGTDQAVEPLHTGSMRAPALFDVTDVLHINALYHLPTLGSAQGFTDKAVNGWWVSTILTAETGYPFGINLSGDPERISYLSGFATRDSPDVVPGRSFYSMTHGTSTCTTGALVGAKLHTYTHWFDPCAFTGQPAGFIGTARRNLLRGPGAFNMDFSAVKDTHAPFLGEAGMVEFRAEFFNVLNHVNFAQPNTTLGAGTCTGALACTPTPSATAGVITAETGTSRQIQFALKLSF